MPIPTDHAQRLILNDEVHARPYAQVEAPERISFLALLAADGGAGAADALARLFERMGRPLPPLDAPHVAADLGTFRLKWERHTEFTSYTFFQRGGFDVPFAASAFDAVPADWLATLPGETMVAAQVAVAKAAGQLPAVWEIAHSFADNPIVGAAVASGAAYVFTDFRVHADRMSRFLLLDRGLGRYRAGRAVQRLLEIETYRMMALLALPVARRVSARSPPPSATCRRSRAMASAERAATAQRAHAPCRGGETRCRRASAPVRRAPVQLTAIGQRSARRAFPGCRPSAGSWRRLAPATNTCESVAKRQDSSPRASHAPAICCAPAWTSSEQQNLQCWRR